MLMPSAFILFASYVGPVASPDLSGQAPQTRSQQIRKHRNQSMYMTPQYREGLQAFPEQAPTVQEKAAKGRLVVPDLFL